MLRRLGVIQLFGFFSLFSLIRGAGSLLFAEAADFPISPPRTSSLSVDDYLLQVEKSNPGYRGLVQEGSATESTSKKADLLFMPQFFTRLQYVDDTRNTHAPLIQGTSNIGRNASVGIQEQTPYGLGVQLSFDVNQSNLFNTDSTYVSTPNLTNTYVVPVFNISLWQNFLGKADRANERVMRAQDLATAYGKSYQARAELVQAESHYWKLAVVRSLLEVQKASFERARAILEFDSKKAKRKLVDPSDVLLAQAAVKGKELELHSMEEEARSAAAAFNAARGQSGEDVPEKLALPDLNDLKALQAVQRTGHRGDIKAAEQETIATTAGNEMAEQKLMPQLSLYGSIFAWGLNFSYPLDISTIASVRSGFARNSDAAELVYQQKMIDEESQWMTLVQKFNEAKERLTIAAELETIQRAKFESVRARRAKGLTIEDQVFQYELDYLNSSLARVQMEGLILGLHTEMKLYAEQASGDAPGVQR